MKITIEESPQSKWIFDTDEIPDNDLRNHILKHIENMMSPIRQYMSEHGEILNIELVESTVSTTDRLE